MFRLQFWQSSSGSAETSALPEEDCNQNVTCKSIVQHQSKISLNSMYICWSSNHDGRRAPDCLVMCILSDVGISSISSTGQTISEQLMVPQAFCTYFYSFLIGAASRLSVLGFSVHWTTFCPSSSSLGTSLPVTRRREMTPKYTGVMEHLALSASSTKHTRSLRIISTLLPWRQHSSASGSEGYSRKD